MAHHNTYLFVKVNSVNKVKIIHLSRNECVCVTHTHTHKITLLKISHQKYFNIRDRN